MNVLGETLRDQHFGYGHVTLPQSSKDFTTIQGPEAFIRVDPVTGLARLKKSSELHRRVFSQTSLVQVKASFGGSNVV